MLSKEYKKLRDLGLTIGHVDVVPRPRYVGEHNCKEEHLYTEKCLEIKEDDDGQYLDYTIVYRCRVCQATYKKEVEK